MSSRPTHYRTRPREGLTPRQVEVIRLVARGYTNAQVAEALGITLDGAKFHVSEIIARLGVESREQAVEAYLADQRPLNRLRSSLTSARRSRAVILTAAALGTAALATLILVVALTRRDSGSSPLVYDPIGPGIWIAMVEPAPYGLITHHPAPLRILDAVTGEERQYGSPDHVYFSPRWSPDGTRLAAIELIRDGDSAAASVIVWSTGGTPIAETAMTDFPGRIGWSPDSTRLAAMMNEGVAVLDQDGALLGSASARPRPDGSFSSVSTRFPDWSPDSSRLAVLQNGILLVVDREGSGVEYPLPNTPNEPNLFGWQDADTLRLHAIAEDDHPTNGLYLASPGPDFSWSGPEPFDLSGVTLNEALRSELMALVPGMTAPSFADTSADGSAEVFVMSGSGQPSLTEVFPKTLVIRIGSEQTIVAIGAVGLHADTTRYLDVLVQPGWSGPLPAILDAATPVDTPLPRTTPSP